MVVGAGVCKRKGRLNGEGGKEEKGSEEDGGSQERRGEVGMREPGGKGRDRKEDDK